MVLLLSLIFTLFLEVQPQVQKDSSTALRHDERETLSHLNQNERPNIKVVSDSENGEFRVLCEIPGSDNGGYICFLSLGDEYPQFKKIQSHVLSGKTQCLFTVLDYEFSNNLKSLENKVVSCSYSSKNTSSKLSYSEKFGITDFYPVKIQSPQTTKGTLTALATESSTCSETTTNLPTDLFPVKIQSPQTTKGTLTALATESSTCSETTTNLPTDLFPVKTQAPQTTKGTLNSTSTFSINTTTIESKTALATESSTCNETTINPPTESTHLSQLNATWSMTAVLEVSTPGENAFDRTSRKKTGLILTLAATSSGIFLTGLMGIFLCCLRLQTRKKR
ncbi:uncharacterized protein LOC122353980 [Puntigrus tetrazona]|uniref:uncharacterized protein LOC122353980 n=1 Tax=Puntigrus tetrazona TaxID=1606681 RepID=UPI001C8A8126|nr:uncharacterized protein LOC122353980 [Puntigrus tetrazona]